MIYIDYKSDDRHIFKNDLSDKIKIKFPNYSNPEYFRELENRAEISITRVNYSSFMTRLYPLENIFEQNVIDDHEFKNHPLIPIISNCFNLDEKPNLQLIVFYKDKNEYIYRYLRASKIKEKYLFFFNKEKIFIRSIYYVFYSPN